MKIMTFNVQHFFDYKNKYNNPLSCGGIYISIYISVISYLLYV